MTAGKSGQNGLILDFETNPVCRWNWNSMNPDQSTVLLSLNFVRITTEKNLNKTPQ
jgi:hypothetical protein